MNVCPLLFNPIFKPKIWGGRTLEKLANKDLPAAEPIGESWEVADLEDDQSVVVEGPAAGRTLRELVTEWGEDLLGGAPLFEGRFPLLVKYLDACENLSVQVHPDRAMAEQFGGSVRVKNEAWYVLGAEPSGCIYRGFIDGVTRQDLQRAIEEGTVAQLLHRIPVHAGDCYYLPSGTVHALGAGVVVAEIQTPSDVTYRVFDWNRVDSATGKPRQLHIEEALQCSRFGSQTIDGELHVTEHTAFGQVTHLIDCESFVIDRVRMDHGSAWEIPTGKLMIFMVLEGNGKIAFGSPAVEMEFSYGDTLVIPAALKGARLNATANCTWLETTLPE